MDMTNNREIYFDNAATTRTDSTAAKAALDAMTEYYGNPSSVHAKGLESAHILKTARKNITDALGYGKNDGRLIFTSCGTEASNTAIFGAYKLYSKNCDNIVISDSEHPSVENCAKELENCGVKVHRIPTKGGKLDLDFADRVIDGKTFLVSCMLVNNETGAVYDTEALKKIRDKNAPKAILHMDAVQGFMKINKKIACFDADAVSISGHKIHAPKGVGALYVKKAIRVFPRMIGGGQEDALRSGTENLPGIAAFGAAAKNADENRDNYARIISDVNECTRKSIAEMCPGVLFNSSDDGFAKHILSISIPGVRSEIMLRYLSERGIYVSAGSACSSKHADNRVLTNFGLDDARADSTLRLSFSRYNTTDEAKAFAEVLAQGIKRLKLQ